MSYRVILSQQAERELEEAVDWWAEHRDPGQAARWYTAISARIDSLSEDPERFSLAEECDDFPYSIREMHFGLSARPSHRIVFTITDENVVILTIRHAARKRLTPDEIPDPP